MNVARGMAIVVGLGACRSKEVTDVRPVIDAAPAVASVVASAPVVEAKAIEARELPSVATDWCIEGLRGLDEDVCYVLPPLAENKPRRLMIYFHGIVPPTKESEQKSKVELAVLHAATRAGAAALVPRGRRGLGPKYAKEWFAWPTDPGTFADYTPAILARLRDAKKKLEGIAGAPFAKTYFAGSSNGAYFLSALALGRELDDLPIDGFGAMSGGATGGRIAAGKTPHPFYVGFGIYDDETKGNARNLVSALTNAHWPVRAVEHPLGHGANEIYIDEAFAFWDESL